MKPNDIAHYALQKLDLAVGSMAVGTESLQKRLYYAYVTFHPVKESDFPKPEMGRQYAAIVRDLTSVPAGKDEGTLAATTAIMSDEEAIRIAREIVDLVDSLRATLK